MTVFEKNVDCIKKRDAGLAEKLSKCPETSASVGVETAVNGESILVLASGETLTALGSVYDPNHASERFVLQLNELPESTTLLLIGFGDGRVLRNILSENCPVKKCIVYEPSAEIFVGAIHTFDLTDVLTNENAVFLVRGLNDKNAEQDIYENLGILDWKTFSIIALPQYALLFPEEASQCFEMYNNVLSIRKGEQISLLDYMESGCRNEIRSQKYMIKSKSVLDLRDAIPTDMPCVVVAAGPSLEKNVSFLKGKKGKVCVIAVDTACRYLLQHDIIPDFVCTIDPIKKFDYLADPRLDGVPFFLSTEAAGEELDKIPNFIPIYVRLTFSYYNYLLEKKKKEICFRDPGGSVATITFRLALDLGFKTVIIIGQDLAYTNRQFHAGMDIKDEKEELDVVLSYGMCEVDAYDGGTVYTTGDFKLYIDWYNRTIPRFNQTHRIINATEGGAKLHGAIQMPLAEALEKYELKEDFQLQTMVESLPEIWESPKEKCEFIDASSEELRNLIELSAEINRAVDQIKELLLLLKKKQGNRPEADKLETEINAVIDKVKKSKVFDLLTSRSADVNIGIHDRLDEKAEDDLLDEKVRLYYMVDSFLRGMKAAIEDAVPIWEQVLKEMKDIYDYPDGKNET